MVDRKKIELELAREEQLWSRYASSGSVADRNAVVAFYAPLAYRLIAGYSRTTRGHQNKEDVAAETMVKFVDIVEKYEPEKWETFKTWMAVKLRFVVADVCRSMFKLRRKTDDNHVPQPGEFFDAFEDLDGPSGIDSNVLRDCMKILLKRFCQRDCLVFYLYYGEGFNLEECGEHFGVGPRVAGRIKNKILRYLVEYSEPVPEVDFEELPQVARGDNVLLDDGCVAVVDTVLAGEISVCVPGVARPVRVSRWEIWDGHRIGSRVAVRSGIGYLEGVVKKSTDQEYEVAVGSRLVVLESLLALPDNISVTKSGQLFWKD